MPSIGTPTSSVFQWVRKRITLDLLGSKLRTQQDAQVCGPVALNTDPEHDHKKWNVTHVGTGMAVCFALATEQEARKVAEVLLRLARTSMSEPTRPGVLRKTPLWVRLWLKECHRAGTYVDHKSYVLGVKE